MNNNSAIRIGATAIDFSDFTEKELDLFEQAIDNARKEIKLRKEREQIIKEAESLFARMEAAGLAFAYKGDCLFPDSAVLEIITDPFFEVE